MYTVYMFVLGACMFVCSADSPLMIVFLEMVLDDSMK